MKRGMRVVCVWMVVLLAVSICVPVIAQTKAVAAGAHKFPTIQFEKYKLKNGLEVILSEDHRLPMVAVDVWYHVGPAYEKPGRTGFAHLFEHMMFQGSKHVKANEHFKLLEAAGATDINGTTGPDRTNYFETVPANQFELALWLESDRMGWLLDNLNGRNLANQRDVVRNERRQGESQPYMLVQEGMMHALFPKGHPYYGDVIGSHADIESAELKDVRDFAQMYYAPNNATVAIVGDYDPKTVKALVEKYFGAIPAGPKPEKAVVKQPVIKTEQRITVTDKITLPRIMIAWQTPAYFQPGDAEMDFVAHALGGGRSSRLYKKLVYEKQIAQDVSAYQQSMMLGSIFIIQATAKPNVHLEDLEKGIEEELQAFQQGGPTEAEMEQQRNRTQAQRIMGLQRLGGFGGVADMLNEFNHYTGDPGYLAKDMERYAKATPEDVKRYAAMLTPRSRVVVYGVPGEKVIDDVPKRPQTELSDAAMPGGPKGEAWRDTPPKPGAVKTPNLPTPRQFKLANGLTVMLVEQHKLPVMTAELVVLRGSEANPQGKPGLASFTAAMLTEGTERRTSPQMADDIAQIGAQVGGTSNSDMSLVYGVGLTWTGDKLFDLLSDAALHPAFRSEEVERVRQRRLVSIMQQKDNPNMLAGRAFAHELYGEKSPYGYIELGTEPSVKALTRDDLVGFYKAGYGPQNSVLMVAGDLTEPQLKAVAEKYFGGWTGEVVKSTPPQTDGTYKRRIVIVDKPNSPQSVLRIGQAGVPRNHPDYVPILLMNDILGGLFTSRINLNLREQHGYTYGAFSYFDFRRGQGPFVIGSMVRTDATAPAVKEVFNELTKMRGAAPSADELDMAKQSELRRLTAMFETTQQTAGTLINLFVYSLPLDFYSTLPGKINAVNAAEVQRVAEQYLAPDKMLVVVAGDRAKIEPELKKLDLGPTEAQDADGKPLPEKATTPGGSK
jgi:zinc protease